MPVFVITKKMVGLTQARILALAESKKFFSMGDVLSFYVNAQEGMRRFDNLVALGYLEKGRNSKTGELVYVSKIVKKDPQQTLPESVRKNQKLPNADRMVEGEFLCPERKGDEKILQIVCTEYCESFSHGSGCKYLSDCPMYVQIKKQEMGVVA